MPPAVPLCKRTYHAQESLLIEIFSYLLYTDNICLLSTAALSSNSAISIITHIRSLKGK